MPLCALFWICIDPTETHNLILQYTMNPDFPATYVLKPVSAARQ